MLKSGRSPVGLGGATRLCADKLFVAGNVIFVSTNEGQSWQPISLGRDSTIASLLSIIPPLTVFVLVAQTFFPPR